jgi:hypothetical protein
MLQSSINYSFFQTAPTSNVSHYTLEQKQKEHCKWVPQFRHLFESQVQVIIPRRKRRNKRRKELFAKIIKPWYFFSFFHFFYLLGIKDPSFICICTFTMQFSNARTKQNHISCFQSFRVYIQQDWLPPVLAVKPWKKVYTGENGRKNGKQTTVAGKIRLISFFLFPRTKVQSETSGWQTVRDNDSIFHFDICAVVSIEFIFI